MTCSECNRLTTPSRARVIVTCGTSTVWVCLRCWREREYAEFYWHNHDINASQLRTLSVRSAGSCE
jgi:hypothetical protein